MEIGKNPLGSWIQISAGSAGSWDFSRKFGLVQDRIKSDVAGGYKRHQLQQK